MSIRIANLELKYKDSKLELLKISNLNIMPGESVILMGANGSGKTTLVDLLYGVTSKIDFTGECEVVGVKLNKININELIILRKKIIFIKQHDSYNDFGRILVKDYLDNLLKSYQNFDYNVNFIVNSFNAKYSKFTNYTISTSTKLSSLSGGQSRLFKVYVSLMVNKYVELIMLDEPINHLDIVGIKLLNNLLLEYKINKPNLIIFIITHFKVFTFTSKLLALNNGVLNQEKINFITESDIGLFGSKVDSKGFFII